MSKTTHRESTESQALDEENQEQLANSSLKNNWGDRKTLQKCLPRPQRSKKIERLSIEFKFEELKSKSFPKSFIYAMLPLLDMFMWLLVFILKW